MLGSDMPDADTAPEREGQTPGKRLDFVQRALILRYRQQHPELTAHAIGQHLGHHHRTVANIIGQHTQDAKALTQALMQTAIPDRLDEWDTACSVGALKGDHRPVRDFLIAAGAIEDSSKAANVAVGFQVVIAPSPGTPAYAVNELPTTVVTGTVAPPLHVLAHAAASAPASDETDAQPTSAPTLTTPIAQCAPSSGSCDASLRTTQSRPSPPAPRSRVRR